MTHDELLHTIDQAKREGWMKLDLNFEDLTKLPVELFQLTQLQELRVGDNILTTLPVEIGQLTHLQVLFAYINQLTALPAEIGQLTQLQKLDVGQNQLTSLPARINQLALLQTLDVSHNQLTMLPVEIGQLVLLQKLHINHNKLTALPVEIGQLAWLQTLYINHNQLTVLPVEIGQLTRLVTLDVSQNQLTELATEIGPLVRLVTLDVSQNQLAELPAEIGRFTRLLTLDVRRNDLTALPVEIGQLAQLEQLDISQNQLTVLPAELGQLTQLQRLDASHNQVTMLPTGLDQLVQLKELDVSSNQLTALPTELSQLVQLQKLNVGYNQLTELPAELGQLTKLRFLDIGDNLLITLPAELSQLAQLQTLEVSNNSLVALPAEFDQLMQLQELHAFSNQLSELPEWLWRLSKLEILDVRDNPLPVPPEVLVTDIDEEDNPKAQPLLREYANIMRDGKPLNEARLIVVGEARAGKTSLMRRLLGEPFDSHEDPTHGILIRKLGVPSDLGEIAVNAWDFGGQDIYKATHQFFLSERAVYVLVLNAAQNEAQNRVEYWLNLIASYGKGARVIVAINQSGSYTLNLDERRYKLTHAHIVDNFIRTDAATDMGLASLRQAIEDEVRGLRHVHTRLYDRHLAIKQRLASKNKSYISREQFAEYCDEAGVTGDEPQAWLLRLLNDLGSAISFDDPNVAGKFVLNPEWVTRGVYAAVERTDGARVRLSDIRAVLDANDYPGDTPSYILNLMRKFELCYPLDEGNDPRYLLLDKLPDNTPAEVEDWERDPDALRLEYEYTALPASVITRVIARLHTLVRGEPWRSGAFLRSADGRNEALIRSDGVTQHTFIAVRGHETTRRDFLAAIRAQFEHVHATVNLIPQAFVPLPAHLLAKAERSKRINPIRYDDLLAAEEAGERDWFVPELRRRVPVRALLDGVRIEVSPQALYDVLTKKFSTDELRRLCGDLGLDFENIYTGEGGKGRSAQEIVDYLRRRENLEPLLRYIRRERPGTI